MTDASNDDTLAQDDLDSLAGGLGGSGAGTGKIVSDSEFLGSGGGGGTGKIIFDESPKEE